MIVAHGESWAPQRRHVEREGIAPSYMTRVLRLTLLAPDIVEAILDGKQGLEVTLALMLASFPTAWNEQSQGFSVSTAA
ncbi:hypothetical protein ACROSR_16670 [Roseovarius tibetensis]|uniref:hypothetical protein n=1 Tax=Roseovarius tibetensis TaxID=2685897 RepID=UPI003D7F75FE